MVKNLKKIFLIAYIKKKGYFFSGIINALK